MELGYSVSVAFSVSRRPHFRRSRVHGRVFGFISDGFAGGAGAHVTSGGLGVCNNLQDATRSRHFGDEMDSQCFTMF